MPGARDAITTLVSKAERAGVQRLVLLSGRGEEEQACERIVLESEIPSTIVRVSWFNQNFSERAFSDMVKSGNITLPADAVRALRRRERHRRCGRSGPDRGRSRERNL